jgi:hypothetical protein
MGNNNPILQKQKTLEDLPIESRNNFEIVLEMVKENGKNLQFASQELQNNPEIVM